MSDFGKAIQTLRKRKNLTQAELAASLNVSGQAVSKWENNLSQPDLDTVQRIMEIFEVSWEEFSALCNNGGEASAEDAMRQRGKDTIAAAATSVTAAATSATAAANSANEAARATMQAAEAIQAQGRLSGVCAYCGKAIYDENKIGMKTPKVVCKDCAERARKRILSKNQTEARNFKKSMIIPAVIVGIIAVALTIIAFANGAGAASLLYLPLGFFVWLPIPQICRETSPVGDIFDGTCGKTIRMPGVIFELSIDGVIWAIVVKIALWLLSAVLGLLLSIAGYIICMVVAPFSFLPVMKSEWRDIENGGRLSDADILGALDGERDVY